MTVSVNILAVKVGVQENSGKLPSVGNWLDCVLIRANFSFSCQSTKKVELNAITNKG